MALLITEVREIHDGSRVIRQDPKYLAIVQIPQPALRLQYREWTLQTGGVKFGIPILIHGVR